MLPPSPFGLFRPRAASLVGVLFFFSAPPLVVSRASARPSRARRILRRASPHKRVAPSARACCIRARRRIFESRPRRDASTPSRRRRPSASPRIHRAVGTATASSRSPRGRRATVGVPVIDARARSRRESARIALERTASLASRRRARRPVPTERWIRRDASSVENSDIRVWTHSVTSTMPRVIHVVMVDCVRMI